jgi:hypothetical protein
MNILVLNSGSSSQKAYLYEIGEALPAHPPAFLWERQVECDGDTADIVVKTNLGMELGLVPQIEFGRGRCRAASFNAQILELRNVCQPAPCGA